MKETILAGKARLTAFFDAATFVELNAHMRRASDISENEGVVCGYGALDGRLVFAFAQDASAMKGALDGRHAEKIAALYAKALSVGAPVVGFFDCAGAVVFEGAAALSGYGKLLATVASASGVIPQIAVIDGVCAGTMAAVAALFDFTVLSNESKLYVGSPTQLGDAVATAAYAAEKRGVALVADDTAQAVRTLLSYLPDHCASGAPNTALDDANRAVALADYTDAATALNAVVDQGTLLALYEGIAPNVKIGLARMGGAPAAVLAIDGELTVAALSKMRNLVSFADAFALPVMSLVNCEGLATSAEDEPRLAAAMADLALVLAKSTAPRVTAIVGAAIGAGFLFGGAKELGADLVLALPGAEIAALTAPAAVAFLWNDRITGEISRADLEKEWTRTVATPENAAATGAIDDIVAPAELRARLIAALYMLEGKANGAPVRRHAVRPM
ncbi:MAG: hypothetical protein IJA78_05210 [Clostridia bacterium]|nr:hypothetical protein [Clostridia bacterium]